MRVDQTPFLKKALSKCRRLRNELNKKQTLLNSYEEQDETAFQQWLNHTFGAKLSKMRELRETLEHYDFILFNLSHCSMFCPEKLPEMHKELFERMKNGTLFQFVPPKPKDLSDDKTAEWDDEDDEWDDDDWEGEDDLDDETVDDIFNQFFGSGEDDFDAESKFNFDMGHPHHHKSVNPSEELLLKKCYRTLAKRLHPDHSTFDESLREKRWHEIQEAYQNNDLEALLRLEAFCDLDENDLSINLGLARLNDLANYHQSHLKPIRRALKEAKQDIAFGFAESGPTKEIKEEMNYEFKGRRINLEYKIRYIQQSIDDLLLEWEEEQEMFESSPDDAIVCAPKTKSNTPKRQQEHDDPRQMSFF